MRPKMLYNELKKTHTHTHTQKETKIDEQLIYKNTADL